MPNVQLNLGAKVAQAEKEALSGTFGSPSENNRFVTESDPRLPIFDLSLNVFFIEAIQTFP